MIPPCLNGINNCYNLRFRGINEYIVRIKDNKAQWNLGNVQVSILHIYKFKVLHLVFLGCFGWVCTEEGGRVETFVQIDNSNSIQFML